MSQRIPRSHLFFPTLLGVSLMATRLGWLGVTDRPQIAWLLPAILVWGLAALGTAWQWRPKLTQIVAIAVAVRLCWVGAQPWLSDDLYRYLWEGQLLSSGGNPFLTAPAEVHGLDDALRAKVNHPEVSTVYPPLALLWFRLLALGTVAWAQLCTAAVDVGTVILLFLLRRDQRRSSWPALLWAIHPLPVLESAVGAHLDVVGVGMAAAGLLMAGRGRLGWAAGWTLAGALTKLLPIAWWFGLWRLAPRRVALGSLLALLLAAPGLLPVVQAGPDALVGVATYARHWSFNGLLHPLLLPMLGGATRPALAMLGAAALGWTLWQRVPLAQAWWLVATVFVMVSPTVHPWYVLWPLFPSLALGRWGWAAGSLSLLAAYAALATLRPDGSWAPQWWLAWATWGGALLCLVAYAAAARREARTSRSDPAPVQENPSAKSIKKGTDA